MDLFPPECGELFQELFLTRRQVSRSFNDYPYVLIPLVISLDVSYSFGFQTENPSRLCSCGYLHLNFSFQGWDLNLRSEGGLDKTNRHLADDVQSVSNKKRVRFYLNYHVKIARNTSCETGFSFAPELKPRPGVHAGWDLDAQCVEPSHAARAGTACTWVSDEGALAATLVAGARDVKKTLLETDLTPASAGLTGFGRSTRLGATSVAGITQSFSRYFDLLFCAKGSLFEADREVVPEVFAARARASPRGSGSEELPEDVAEDVFKASREIKSSSERTPISKCGVAELIVLNPFLRID